MTDAEREDALWRYRHELARERDANIGRWNMMPRERRARWPELPRALQQRWG